MHRRLAVTCLAVMAAIGLGGAGQTTQSEFQRKMMADPEWVELMRQGFVGTAARMVRIQRLVSIGVLCQSLSEEDAELIFSNADEEITYAYGRLAEQHQAWASAYLEGVRMGALQSADLLDAVNEDACRRFAAPGGDLVKILTWTDRPQEISPGIRASPRTLP